MRGAFGVTLFWRGVAARRILVFFSLAWLLISAGVDAAQAGFLTLTPPNSRFAAPGDYVTLVFRVEAPRAQTPGAEPLKVEAEARSSLGWQILRQPGTLTLEPGQSRPVALTLAVPNDAPAFTENIVTLELDGDEAQTGVTVSERLSLDLEAPEAIVLSSEGFSVTLINRGNVRSQARLELRQRDEVLAARERELAPQERLGLRLEVPREGRYTLVLAAQDREGMEVRKTLSVTRFGAPPPPPFALAADASASLGTEGWRGGLGVEGPLSDFVTLNARMDAKDALSSYASLTHEAWTAKLGGGASDPYRLSLTAGVGVSGSYHAPRWSVAGALGGLTDAASGYVAGNYRDEDVAVAGGLGVERGGVQVSVRGGADLGAFSLAGSARYGDALDLSLEAETVSSIGTLEGQLKLAQFLGEDAALSARLDLYGASEHLYASGNWFLSEGASSEGSDSENSPNETSLNSPTEAQWSVGLQDRLVLDSIFNAVLGEVPSALGEFTLGLEVGSQLGFARLQYDDASLARAWRTESRFGVVYGADGLGLGASARLSQSRVDYYSLGGNLIYYPRTAHLDGQFDLKLQTTFAPFTLYNNGTWNLSEKQLGLNAGTVWYSGPWRVDVAGNASYSYAAGVTAPLTFGLSLSSDYAFDIPVPRAVSELAGGRRVGSVGGVVHSDAGPLAGAEVKVGRFRLLTDEEGRYHAEVAPGTYKVNLELGSLPITYRFLGEDAVSVEVALKEAATHDFRLVRTAALRGRVLEDADANGVADTPARGLAARLLLVDPEGLYRSLNTDEQGNFSARGLLPGEGALQLMSYPVGSILVGEGARELAMRAGEVTEVTFLLQPARTRARSFGSSALRVRRVTLNTERVPPGAAPLISVRVQGDADEVSVSAAAGPSSLSLRGDMWLGRVAVPQDTPPGVYPFEVSARRGAETASRRGQLVIDPDIALLDAAADGPVRAGEALEPLRYTPFRSG